MVRTNQTNKLNFNSCIKFSHIFMNSMSKLRLTKWTNEICKLCSVAVTFDLALPSFLSQLIFKAQQLSTHKSIYKIILKLIKISSSNMFV